MGAECAPDNSGGLRMTGGGDLGGGDVVEFGYGPTGSGFGGGEGMPTMTDVPADVDAPAKADAPAKLDVPAEADASAKTDLPAEVDAPPRDPAGFVAWARPHLNAMTLLAGRLAPGANPDAIVQNALSRACTIRNRYNPARHTPSTWLLKLTATQSHKTKRHNRRRTISPKTRADKYPNDAYLNGTHLNDASLNNATLHGEGRPGAKPSGANLHGAGVSGARASGAGVSGADLNGANLSGAGVGAGAGRVLPVLDARGDLEDALLSLSVRQRLAVDCYYFADLTIAETAAVMSCSEGTVRSTLSAARTHLRTLLEVPE